MIFAPEGNDEIRNPAKCHCEEPVAAVEDPEVYEPLGPAAQALCVACLPFRCDAYPGDCDR